jgi:hypothetical protein
VSTPEAYARLLGRAPTDAERAQIERIRDALDIPDNDALWTVLVALEYHRHLYAAIPASIHQAAQSARTEVRRDLSREVAAAIASQTASGARRWAVAAALAIAVTYAGGMSWAHHVGHQAGYAAGEAAGYSSARDEQAAAAWSATPEGQLAYRMAQTGELAMLARCTKPGWRRDGSVCYPEATPTGLYGWRMP